MNDILTRARLWPVRCTGGVRPRRRRRYNTRVRVRRCGSYRRRRRRRVQMMNFPARSSCWTVGRRAHKHNGHRRRKIRTYRKRFYFILIFFSFHVRTRSTLWIYTLQIRSFEIYSDRLVVMRINSAVPRVVVAVFVARPRVAGCFFFAARRSTLGSG